MTTFSRKIMNIQPLKLHSAPAWRAVLLASVISDTQFYVMDDRDISPLSLRVKGNSLCSLALT